MKEKCVGVGCENVLPQTIDWYNRHGNFCRKCIKKAERNAMPIIKPDILREDEEYEKMEIEYLTATQAHQKAREIMKQFH